MITDFSKIIFNEQRHTYSYEGVYFDSVTRVLNKLKPEFKRDEIATRTSIKTGKSTQEILKSWDLTSKQALEKGTAIHTYAEEILLKKEITLTQLQKRVLVETKAFDRFWQVAGAFYIPKHIEYIVGDTEFRIAGTIDAVLFDEKGQKYYLFDWKTGRRYRTNNGYGKTLKAPFDHLDNCELTNHSLQLSLYRLIIERNTDLEMGGMYIIHLSDEYEVHEATDYSKELLDWLKNSRKLPSNPRRSGSL